MIKKLNFNQKVEFIFDENLTYKKIDKLNLKIYSKIFLYVDYNLSKSSKLFIKKVTKINKNICLKYLKPGENLKDLEYQQLFCFKDTDKFVYGFDICSLYNMLAVEKCNKNPYNRKIIPPITLGSLKKIINLWNVYILV